MILVNLKDLVIKKDMRKCKNEELLLADNIKVYFKGKDITGNTTKIIIILEPGEPISCEIETISLK